jgi:DNA-directed RNA polymerase subunit M/transcription elongation factor TFIIS/DNA-directed RNA polymerase subunit H (RpoH/RPB5)
MDLMYIRETILNTCHVLLTVRGYNLVESNDEFLIGQNRKKNRILIFLTLLDKFDSAAYVSYSSTLDKLSINRGIAIYVNSVTTKANSDLLEFKDNNVIELFMYKELMSNPLDHCLQPRFEKLTQEKSSEFKEKYGTKFPIMKKTDKIARFMGYERGDVIKITDKNGNVSYRIVKGYDSGKSIGVVGGQIGCCLCVDEDVLIDIDKITNTLSLVIKDISVIDQIIEILYDTVNTESEFTDIIYQIVTDLQSSATDIETVLSDLTSEKVRWEHKQFETEKSSLLEQDDFIETPFELEEGMIECNRCGSKKVYTYSKQVRSGDEGYTTFAECINCKLKWTTGG